MKGKHYSKTSDLPNDAQVKAYAKKHKKRLEQQDKTIEKLGKEIFFTLFSNHKECLEYLRRIRQKELYLSEIEDQLMNLLDYFPEYDLADFNCVMAWVRTQHNADIQIMKRDFYRGVVK